MTCSGHVFLVLALLATACGGDRQEGGEAARAGEGMQSTQMPSMDMMPTVRAYLDSIIGAEPGDLPSMVAGHRARIEQMLSAMDQDMTAMDMAADAAWQAAADSVRTDLSAISRLSGEQLVLRMRAHAGRMRRLLQMHERMMGHMPM
jgi:hypothetical protein